MSINIIDFKDALLQLPDRKTLFFVPKDSVKYIRFVNDFDSFFAVKLHRNYNEEQGRYETLLVI
jgi:hypothetical protein